jgi:type I restriction enzyme M protein
MSDIVNKLWGMAHTLRHDGMDYGDYIEQLTFLLFLKMADEMGRDLSKVEYQDDAGEKVKVNCSWAHLKSKSGTSLTHHYSDVFRALSKQSGLLGEVFKQAVDRFNDPVNMKKVVNLIDEEEWSGMEVDVKGAAFEGLLEKAAAEGKKGAGQYFTPRIVIRSIVNVMKPDPRGKEFRICDPACGTAGFLMVAYEWLLDVCGGVPDRKDMKRIREKTYFGQELVARPRRLALMNLFLHGLEPTIYSGDSIYEPDRGERYDCVLTNPPFGTKGAAQAPTREDFSVESSNKQLNFVQHVVTILKPGGRAAMVLPDNVLFAEQAGEVMKFLMQDCNLHTILRLPNGTFTPYSQGVKANVLFFQKGVPTKEVWVYDNRANIPIVTKKDRPLTAEMFAEFEEKYGEDPNGLSKRRQTGEDGRWRKFSLEEIQNRGYNLDLSWLKDENLEDPNDLPDPKVLAEDAITELNACVDELQTIVDLVGAEANT